MVSLRECQPQDLLNMNMCNLDPLTENYSQGFYYHYMSNWPSLFIVAENQDRDIIGYVMGKVEEDPALLKFMGDKYLPWHGHVTALTVAKQYRGQGVARMLTTALEDACEAENAWFMDLFVRASNLKAINMYKKMGDDPTGKSDFEDAFDMRKSLSRDKEKLYIRENGENHCISPDDIYHA
ncbi:MAG: hypothetical protein LQ342_005572 [Letrouitia transgressa]|nr:MAG: hypothetical protein LQ342_005572 [Letrouitia transgressa]